MDILKKTRIRKIRNGWIRYQTVKIPKFRETKHLITNKIQTEKRIIKLKMKIIMSG